MSGKIGWKGNFTVTNNKLYIVSAVLFLVMVHMDLLTVYRVAFGAAEKSFFDLIVYYAIEMIALTLLSISLFMREGWLLTLGGLGLYAADRFVAMGECVLGHYDTDDKVRFVLIFLSAGGAAAIYFCSVKGSAEIRKAMQFMWFIPGALRIITMAMLFHFYEIKNPFRYGLMGDYAMIAGLFLFLFAASHAEPVSSPDGIAPSDPAVKVVEKQSESLDTSGTVSQFGSAENSSGRVDLTKRS